MDFSWIIEEERLENIQENCNREKIERIELTSIYINKDNEIETVERETMNVSTIPVLTREILTEWIQQRKKFTPNSEFQIKDILWFHVPIEPDNIPEIKPDATTFFHTFTLPLTKSDNDRSDNDRSDNDRSEIPEIKIEPAIFIFHSIATLYFCFYEIAFETKPKTNTSLPKKKRTVKINITNPMIDQQKKKVRITRRNHIQTPPATDKSNPNPNLSKG